MLPIRVDKPGSLVNTVGAGGVVCPGHHCLAAVILHRFENLLVVTGNGDRTDIRVAGLFQNTHDHGFSADVGKRFARQSGGSKAGRDNHKSSGQSGLHGAGRVEKNAKNTCRVRLSYQMPF